MRLAIIFIICLAAIKAHSQSYNDSKFKIKLSPIVYFDNSGGNALALQFEYTINKKISICIENYEYINRKSDRFLDIDGRRSSISFRRYRYIPDLKSETGRTPGVGAYTELEIGYKNQTYTTIGNVYNERLDTMYERTLNFHKQIAIANLKIGTVNYIHNRFYVELAAGLGIRMRRISIDHLDNSDDKIGNIPSQQITTYWWSDHKKTGFIPYFSASLRFTYLLPI